MIDDFVKRPAPSKRRPTPKTKAESTDFLPDLSQKVASKPPAKEEVFVTPEEVAAKDELDNTTAPPIDEVIDMGAATGASVKPSKAHWWTRFGNWFADLSKKQK